MSTENESTEEEGISDILSLADVCVSATEVGMWTLKQKEQATMWAAKTHFAASDNYGVKVPKKPKFLNEYPSMSDVLNKNGQFEPGTLKALRVQKARMVRAGLPDDFIDMNAVSEYNPKKKEK